jgi:Methyltransferase domain
MLESSREEILRRLPDDARVLDVGGGANPFPRADWVIDLLAYNERSLYGATPDPESERFSPATWIQRDICAREPWPFADHEFDFVVCSHTLEDVRDPIHVCDELIRVSPAGYIEVPSRLEEQSYGFQGPWVGWAHHRWLIDLEEDELTFVFKHHVLCGRASDRFPTEFHAALTAEQRVLRLFWEGRFAYRERVFLSGPELDAYLQEFVGRHNPPAGPARLGNRFRRRGRP